MVQALVVRASTFSAKLKLRQKVRRLLPVDRSDQVHHFLLSSRIGLNVALGGAECSEIERSEFDSRALHLPATAVMIRERA